MSRKSIFEIVCKFIHVTEGFYLWALDGLTLEGWLVNHRPLDDSSELVITHVQNQSVGRSHVRMHTWVNLTKQWLLTPWAQLTHLLNGTRIKRHQNQQEQGWPLAGKVTVLLGVAREPNPYTGTRQVNKHNIGNILPKHTWHLRR